MGNSTKFAKHLEDRTDQLVRNRGFKHSEEKEVNRKHIQSLAERITDRLIETIEENPYEKWYELNPDKSDKSNDMAILPPNKYDYWVTSTSEANAPYGTLGYWEWIFSKASGENV